MASLNHGYVALRRTLQPPSSPWQPLRQQFRALQLCPSSSCRRLMSTENGDAAFSEKIRAAPEIDLKPFDRRTATPVHARALPVSPSYFSRQPQFNDSYLVLQKLIRRHANLPILPAGQVERVAWKSLTEYRQTIGEQVKASDYVRCIELVKRLHQIHPQLKPQDVTDALQSFKRDIQAFNNVPKVVPVDRFGRTLGVGRRKTSVARAWMVEGTGEVQINGKSLAEAFGRVHDRESAVWGLRATGRLDKFNVWALVEGGGTTGQAEALGLAVAKALLAHEPALKPALRRAGLITRDRRKVERKKHGHVKARKMPAWVKR